MLQLGSSVRAAREVPDRVGRAPRKTLSIMIILDEREEAHKMVTLCRCESGGAGDFVR